MDERKKERERGCVLVILCDLSFSHFGLILIRLTNRMEMWNLKKKCFKKQNFIIINFLCVVCPSSPPPHTRIISCCFILLSTNLVRSVLFCSALMCHVFTAVVLFLFCHPFLYFFCFLQVNISS